MSNNPHRFSLISRSCLGCDVAASTVEDAGNRETELCPAYYSTFDNDGHPVTVIIRPDERAVIDTRFERILLGKTAMFELRDAIEDGVAKVRRS